MRLPEDDEAYLVDKGYQWSVVVTNEGGCLVLANHELSAKYDRDRADVMIRIPNGYNIAALDMFYVDPAIRLRGSGAFPQAADQFEDHGGRRWQRFSRHLPSPWRPGVDGLPMFLSLVNKELRGL